MSVEPELAGAGGRGTAALPGGGPRRAWSRLHDAWLRVPLLRFLVRRLASLVVVVWVVEIATFLMVRLMPGDPAREVLGPHASAQAVAALRHQLGLDRPLLSEYFHYTSGALEPELRPSFYTHLPVSQELSSRVGAGDRAGRARGRDHPRARDRRRPRRRRADRRPPPPARRAAVRVRRPASLGSVPGYVAATVLALLFAVTWQLLPVAGNSPADAVILPALSIALPQSALLARIVRVETLNVLAQNYVRSARSKRLGAGHDLPALRAAERDDRGADARRHDLHAEHRQRDHRRERLRLARARGAADAGGAAARLPGDRGRARCCWR